MITEKIPVKSDINNQVDPQHELNAAEINAMVDDIIQAKMDIINLKIGKGEIPTEITFALSKLIVLGIDIDTVNDVLTIGGKRYKLTVNRDILRTETEYSTPTLNVQYGDIPAGGGSTQAPTITFTQTKTTRVVYADESVEESAETLNGSVTNASYSKVSGDASVAADGIVTYNIEATSTSRASRAVVKVTASVNGVSGEKQVTVYQGAATDKVIGTEYSDMTVTANSFKYGSKNSATGKQTVSSTPSYKVVKTIKHSVSADVTENITTGATIVYDISNYNGLTSDVEINRSTGELTWKTANTSTSNARSVTVTATITLTLENGETKTKTISATATQSAAAEPLGFYGYNSTKSIPTTDEEVKAGTSISSSPLSIDFSQSPLAGSTAAWVAVKKGKNVSIKDDDNDDQLKSTTSTDSYDIRYYSGRAFSTKIKVTIS